MIEKLCMLALVVYLGADGLDNVLDRLGVMYLMHNSSSLRVRLLL